MTDINHSFRRVARATYGIATSNLGDRTRLEAIKKVLDQAATELEKLGA